MSRRHLLCPVAARAGRAARRLVQCLLRPILAVAVLVLARSVAGTVVTAIVGAVVLTVGLVWWWARVVEPWLFSTGPQRPSSQQVRPVMQPPPSPSDAERHLQFAEALAFVANHYLAECEREAGRDTEARR
jgi:hypothetical protein